MHPLVALVLLVALVVLVWAAYRTGYSRGYRTGFDKGSRILERFWDDQQDRPDSP